TPTRPMHPPHALTGSRRGRTGTALGPCNVPTARCSTQGGLGAATVRAAMGTFGWSQPRAAARYWSWSGRGGKGAWPMSVRAGTVGTAQDRAVVAYAPRPRSNPAAAQAVVAARRD